MRYSLPYTEGLFDYLEKSDKLAYVNDVYFSDHAIFPSARYSPLEIKHWDEIKKIRDDLKIPLNYIINPAVYDPSIYLGEKNTLINKLTLFKEFGFSAVTLNNTMLLRDFGIRHALKPFEVKNSVNNMIVSLEQVKHLVDVIGLESVFLGRDINRNLDEIKRIRNAYPKIKLHLLGNENCYPRCVYKQFCDSLVTQSSGSEDFNKLNNMRTDLACDQRNFTLYQKLANNMIHPAHIPHLEGIVDVIKISGRFAPVESIVKVFEAYVTLDNKTFLESLHKGLSKIMEDVEQYYYIHTLTCKNQCATCAMCEVASTEIKKPDCGKHCPTCEGC